MPIAKGTLIFQGLGYGWTESIWISRSYTSLADFYALFAQYAILRAPMLGTPCFIKGIRVSNEAVAHDSFLNYVNLPGSAAFGADDPSSSLNVILRDATFSRFKRIFFRGIWDVVAQNFGEYDIGNEAFRTFFQSWRNFVLLQDFGWMGVDPTQAKIGNISGYTPTVEGNIAFQLDQPIFNGILPGTRVPVRVSRLNGGSTLNGQMVVNVTTNTTCTTTVPTAALPFRTAGVMRFSPKVFIDSFACDTQRIGRRPVGAPLLDSVGRAKKRIRG